MRVYNTKHFLKILFSLHKSDTLKILFPTMVLVGLYSYGMQFLEIEYLHLTPKSKVSNVGLIHTLLGFVLSLLLVFRTNTAYDRWWEGRKLWGKLVNDSRNFAIKINVLLKDDRDSAEQMAKDELTQGLISATSIATYDPNSPGMQTAIAQYVGSVINMKYGREDELEADRFGVKYLFETGYKPEAQIEVMQILEKASGNQRQPEFLSTHPSPGNRIEEIKKYIKEYEKK